METDYLNYSARKIAEESFLAFQNQSIIAQISSIALVVWVIGGFLNDGSLYIAGLLFTAVFYILAIGEVFNNHQRLVSIQKMSFRRTLWGWIAYWLYATVGKTGPLIVSFLGYSFAIEQYTPIAIGIYLSIWLATRYLNPTKWSSELTSDKVLLLFLQGIAKGVILVAFFLALTKNNNISPDYYLYVMIAYLLDPLLAGVFAYFDDVYSSNSMIVTDSKLPGTAIRDVLITDFLLMLITGGFDHQLSTAIGDLRVLYLFALLIALVNARNATADFLKNPLKKSTIGNFVDNLQQELTENVNKYSETYVAKGTVTVELNDVSAISVEPGALVIPLEEGKNIVKAVIIGKGQNIIKKDNQLIPQALDGLTTTQIPKQQYTELIRQMQKTSLGQIDLEQLGLPSLQELQYMIDDLALNINAWITAAKQHLTRFDISSYGIYESKELTKVNLPGISVIESKGKGDMPKFTKVKIAGLLSVLDEGKKGTIVKLPGLQVIDKPKYTFVDLPFLTVFDLHDKETKQKGTMVNLFGFKIGDQLDASKLDYIRNMLMQAANDQLSSFDANFEQILRDKHSVPIFNLAANGSFHPLLTASTAVLGSHIALPANSSALLPTTSKPKPPKALDAGKYVDTDYEIVDE